MILFERKNTKIVR